MRRCLPSAALYTLLFASVAAGRSSEWHAVAKSFRGCCHGKSDVDVQQLLSSTRSYCDLLARFGRFVSPSVANVRSCIDKVDTGRREMRAQTKLKLRSVKELLRSERSKHQKGAILADPSAAMGLLWLRRGLEFWIKVFELQIAALKKKDQGATLAAQCDEAYRRVVKPFHGWASRRGAAVAFGLTPEWALVCDRGGLSVEDDKLRRELGEIVSATRELCDRLRKLQVKFELEDLRKSI